LAENVRIPSYGGEGLKLLKKRHIIFKRFLYLFLCSGNHEILCGIRKGPITIPKLPFLQCSRQNLLHSPPEKYHEIATAILPVTRERFLNRGAEDFAWKFLAVPEKS